MTATGYASGGLFEQEAFELLTDLENGLLRAEEAPEDGDTIAGIFRALHTIKGSAAMFGYDNISAFLHEVESVFDLVRSRLLPVSRDLIDLTLSAGDEVRRMLQGAADSEEDRSRAKGIIASFASLRANGGNGEEVRRPKSGAAQKHAEKDHLPHTAETPPKCFQQRRQPPAVVRRIDGARSGKHYCTA